MRAVAQRTLKRPSRAAADDLWPAVAVAALIFLLSSLSLRAPERAPDWSDVAAHVALFGALCATLRRAWRRRAWRRPAAGPVLATVLYGVSDELHQLLVPGRSGDWRDVVADAAGALLGLGVAALLARRS